MRRSDREISSFEEQMEVMRRCDCCRVAFHDAQYLYIVPLNFGEAVETGHLVLYFHGAAEGKKLDLMRQNSNVCFEMDCMHEVAADYGKGMCTMTYESLIGFGTMQPVPDDRRRHALEVLCAHYDLGGRFSINESTMAHTAV